MADSRKRKRDDNEEKISVEPAEENEIHSSKKSKKEPNDKKEEFEKENYEMETDTEVGFFYTLNLLPTSATKQEKLKFLTSLEVPSVNKLPDQVQKSPAYKVFIASLREFAKNVMDANGNRLDIIIKTFGDAVEIILKDNGTGFPTGMVQRDILKNYTEMLDNPYSFASEKKKDKKSLGGSGLGLAQANKFLLLNNGALLISNTESGALIKITSPRECVSPVTFEEIRASHSSWFNTTDDDEITKSVLSGFPKSKAS